MYIMKPKAIDLFSGCGGLTLGLKKGGFRVIAAIEIDPLAVKTYKENHKRTFVWDNDIRKISAIGLMRKLGLQRGDLDLLAGCPPCQGFSNLSTRNGTKRNSDPRNNLVTDMLRFVSVLRPKAVMFENVPGIKNKKVFKDFRVRLRKLGYQINYEIKDVSKYGVPQRRKRLILLAGKGFKIQFAPESSQIKTVRDSIYKLLNTGNCKDPLHNYSVKHTDKIKRLIRDIPKNGGSRLDLLKERQLKCHKEFDGFKDVYGRMSWDDVAPTITGGCINPSKGRFLHPTKNRPITLREAALLQSFPPRYYFPFSAGKNPVALLIGNALPPEFVKYHALEIKKSLIGL